MRNLLEETETVRHRMPLRDVLLQLAQTARRPQMHLQPQGNGQGKIDQAGSEGAERQDRVHLIVSNLISYHPSIHFDHLNTIEQAQTKKYSYFGYFS